MKGGILIPMFCNYYYFIMKNEPRHSCHDSELDTSNPCKGFFSHQTYVSSTSARKKKRQKNKIDRRRPPPPLSTMSRGRGALIWRYWSAVTFGCRAWRSVLASNHEIEGWKPKSVLRHLFQSLVLKWAGRKFGLKHLNDLGPVSMLDAFINFLHR